MILWNYFTGVGILALMVSGAVGKGDRPAALLFALYLLLVILLVHLPGTATDPQDFQNIFRAAHMMGEPYCTLRLLPATSAYPG